MTKAKGLGDTIEKITQATGIKKAVEWFAEKTGVDCGCEERKKYLNEKIKYKSYNCMTYDQYKLWGATRMRAKQGKLVHEDSTTVFELHKALFGTPRKKPCTQCRTAKIYISMVKNLEALWLSYNPATAKNILK